MRPLAKCALALAVVLVTCAVSEAQFQPSVVPIVNCVTSHPDTGTLDVFFGYASSFTTNVAIDVGSQNFFFPGSQNRNQPTVFEPGVHDRVFFTSFTPIPQQSELSWSLNGTIVTAFDDPNLACNTQGPGFHPASLRTVTATSTTPTAKAQCASTEVVMSGGGSCHTRRGTIHQIGSSGPSSNGWEVQCFHRQALATATALCAPSQ